MSKYIIIPIIFTSTIVYGDNQKFNEYAIFCEKMIVTLQSCTDEKSTFSHSSEFPIILYTVLNENPLKDFFKSQKGALYHIMLLAEIERSCRSNRSRKKYLMQRHRGSKFCCFRQGKNC